MKIIPYLIAAVYTVFLAVLPIFSEAFREKLFEEGTWRYYFVGLPVIFCIIAFGIKSARGVAHRMSRYIAEKIVQHRKRRRELMEERQESRSQ